MADTLFLFSSYSVTAASAVVLIAAAVILIISASAAVVIVACKNEDKDDKKNPVAVASVTEEHSQNLPSLLSLYTMKENKKGDKSKKHLQ